MVDWRKYSEAQVIKMLNRPFAYDYGLNADKLATFCMTHDPKHIRKYNLTYTKLMNYYIPLLYRELGGCANFLFIMANEGDGAGNWINHYRFDTSQDPIECMRQDCYYVLDVVNHTYPPSMSDGATVPYEDNPGRIQQVYNMMKNQTLGKYYVASTLAGNAWNWMHRWCMANQPIWGDPYSNIIDWVTQMGGDPYGVPTGNTHPKPAGDPSSDKKPTPSNPGGQGKGKDEEHVKPKTINPGRIYLSGSLPVKLEDNLKFTRFNNFLTINYDLKKTDEGKDTQQNINNEAEVDQASQVEMKVKYDYTYALGQGQGDSRVARRQIIVAHDTGNARNTGPDSAKNEAIYMRDHFNEQYTHGIAGHDRVYIIGKPGYVAWGCYESGNIRSPYQLELARYADHNLAIKAYNVWITSMREQAKNYKIPLTLDDSTEYGVKTHRWVTNKWHETDHTDPWDYLHDIGVSPAKFKQDIAHGIMVAGSKKKNKDATNPQKVQNIMQQLRNIWGKNYYYSGARPVTDLHRQGFCDCSSFVGWVIRGVYPWAYQNGYSDTSTQYPAMKKAGLQVFYTDQGNSAMKNWCKNLVTGDIVFSSQSPNMGGGSLSHVGIMAGMGEGAPYVNQTGNGTFWQYSLPQTINFYTTPATQFKYWAVMRIK